MKNEKEYLTDRIIDLEKLKKYEETRLELEKKRHDVAIELYNTEQRYAEKRRDMIIQEETSVAPTFN